MSMKVLGTRAGQPSFDALADAIDDAQRLDRLSPVTVVAPSARAAIHLRRVVPRRIGERRGRFGIANVTFVVLSRLAANLAEDDLVAEGRRPLTRVAIGAACRAE